MSSQPLNLSVIGYSNLHIESSTNFHLILSDFCLECQHVRYCIFPPTINQQLSTTRGKYAILNPVLQGITKKKSLNNQLIIKGFFCDPGAIQTHDLQNRNLTLYSLSYGAILSKCEDKSIKNLLIFLMILLFL